MLPVRRSLEFTLDRESDQENESEYESSSSPSPSPPPPPPYDMSWQQQQQQPRGEPSQTPTQQLLPPICKEQLLAMIATITNGHLLICDWCFRILKGSKMQSLDSDKRCC